MKRRFPAQASIDKRFGRVVAKEIVGKDGRGNSIIRCQCDCGKQCFIILSLLRSGNTQSCGCLRRETTSKALKDLHERLTTHGKSNTPEFWVWIGMKARCHSIGHKAYHNYGGRGIVVCDHWLKSFENFLTDMGTRPGPRYTIERKDNNGPYSPDNCKWATYKEQARNKRTNRLVELNGVTKPLIEFCSDLRHYDLTWNRLKAGWTLEEALTTPAYRKGATPVTEFSALQIIYNYRRKSEPTAVPEILELTQHAGFLRAKKTAIGWSGVIVALCEAHPDRVKGWEMKYGDVIKQACRVANSPSSFNDPLWANHLTFRWLILGSDREAWTLLCRAHHKDTGIRNAAQAAIERICTGVETCDRNGFPVTNSQGTVLGKVEFEDLQQQILLLAKEFSNLTWAQRALPFSVIPFSAEYRLLRAGQPLLGLLQSASGLLQ